MTTDRPTHDMLPVEALLSRAPRCDSAARREIEAQCVELEMPFARKIARRYAHRGLPLDDLDQVAYLGLVKAVRRFDPARGRSFHSFAVVTVRGELRRYFRDCGWMVRPPRGLQELQARLWKTEAELTESLCRAPTLSEIARAADVDESQASEALGLTSCFSPRSLDAPRPQHEGSPLADTVGAVDDAFELAEMRTVLAQCALTLSERDRRILELRFAQGKTQKQIGDAIGITQMQVSRLLTRILRDLRAAVDDGCAA